MTKTGIEWCTHTWTPVKGCSHISPGCDYCYADSTAEGKKNNPVTDRYIHGFALESNDRFLLEPLAEQKRCLVFLTSMGDIFHTEKQKSTGNRITETFIQSMFGVMNATVDRHIYQVLTKRPHNISKITNLDYSKNIWLGTSVESPKYYSRIKHLQEAPAKTRFLSIEPMIEGMAGHKNTSLNIENHLKGIDWIICGGESYDRTPEKHIYDEVLTARHGKKLTSGQLKDIIADSKELTKLLQAEVTKRRSRIMQVIWAMQIREICAKKGMKFFFKQYGYMGSKKSHRLLPTVSIPEYKHLLSEKGIALDDIPSQIDFIKENQKSLKARQYNEMPEDGLAIWRNWKPKDKFTN